MRLDIEPDVFTSGDRLSVIHLLGLAVEGQHEWRPSLPAAISAERFATEQAPLFSEFVQQALVEAANPAPAAPAVARISADRLKELVSDLRRPATLIVENRIADGGFVRAVAAALGDHQVVEALSQQPPWLGFSHGGGSGDIPELAADERAGFTVLVRVAVLFDSDRKAASDPGRNQEDKAMKCRDNGVAEVHLLAWRMMENYAPFRVWEHHFAHRPEHVDELRAIEPEQRGYLHLKTWFKGRRCHPPKRVFPAELTLTEEDFAELGPEVVAELRELLAMIHRIL
ncbi:hypothetical protein [Salinispora sp. H7-4]|uniref:hypothetical protein n=1 Tax=Salinispora sp. H7-4 TaxID=2748321 RepID=UPI0015D21455|nr:hypothetical protein [Salinispora sp. H7-4]NYT96505.1 hypothetical protein [Salinispora sp. H7-4]